MPRKKTVSVKMDPEIARRFYESTEPFYGKTGLCFSAAVLMWLEADPQTRGAYLKRVFEAEVGGEVEQMLAAAEAAFREKLAAKGGRAGGGRRRG